MSIPRDVIESVLQAGVQAPSGGNSQPWKFEVLGNQIRIISLPEKDHPILNYKHRGTWIAHGALIENIDIAAAAKGYRADTRLFPDSQELKVTAHITLIPDTTTPSPLYEAIFKRGTNRKPYHAQPLSKEQESSLLKAIEGIPDCAVTFLAEQEKMQRVARALSVAERVMFENKELHRLFFNEVVWNKEEEQEKRGGLNAQTLELEPPQLLLMRLCMKHWISMSLLNKIGMARLIAKDNSKIYSKASLMGALSVTEDRDESYVNVGRALQRIWLTAASMGLSLHPITGVLFLWQKIQAGEANLFSKNHQKLITEAYKEIKREFNPKGTIAFLFRIGEGGSPTAQSIKFPPHVIFHQ